MRRLVMIAAVLAAPVVSVALWQATQAAPPTFGQPVDNFVSALSQPHNPGGTTVTLRTGDGNKLAALTISPTAPLRFSLVKTTAWSNGLVIDATRKADYLATGRSGDTLTGVSLEAGTDQAFVTGDYVFGFITAKTVTEVQTAVVGLSNTKLDAAGNGSSVTATAARTGEVARTMGARLADAVNVRDFGAAGDGTTDDTAAVSAALTAATANSLPVDFPTGTYLTAPQTVPTGVTLRGPPTAVLKLKAGVVNNSTGTAILTFSARSGAVGLTLDGNPSGNPAPAQYATALAYVASPSVTIRGTAFQNSVANGVFAITAPDLTVQDCTFSGLGSDPSNLTAAVFITDQSHRFKVIGNKITNCAGAGIKTAPDSAAHPAVTAVGGLIDNNVIDYTGVTVCPNTPAVECARSQTGRFTGNVVTNNVYYGPAAVASSVFFGFSVTCTDGPVVTGNKGYGTPAVVSVGLELVNTSRAVATANEINGAAQGFTLGGALGSFHPIVKGNQFNNCTIGGQIGGDAGAVTAMDVEGNTFVDCGPRCVFVLNTGGGGRIAGNKFRVSAQTTPGSDGYPSGSMMAVYAYGSGASGMLIEDNVGSAVSGGACASGVALIEANGSGSHVVKNNVFDGTAPGGAVNVNAAVYLTGGPGGNTFVGNKLSHYVNAFTETGDSAASSMRDNVLLSNTANFSVTPNFHDISGTITAVGVAPSVTFGRVNGLVQDKGGQVYNALAYGFVADGVTDNSPAWAALKPILQANDGGTVFFPAAAQPYVFLSPIVFPTTNDYTGTPGPVGTQAPVTLLGGGRWQSNAANGAVLDLQYQGANGKVQSYGNGVLKIENLGLQNSLNVNDTTPFVYVTNTVLHIKECFFRGARDSTIAPPSFQTNVWPGQDGIVYGGNGAANDNSPSSGFGGYGGTVERCLFTALRRVALLNANANVLSFRDLYVLSGGNGNAYGAAIELADQGVGQGAGAGTNNVSIENVSIEGGNYQSVVRFGPGVWGCSARNPSAQDVWKATLAWATPVPGSAYGPAPGYAAVLAGQATIASSKYYPPGTVLQIRGTNTETATVAAGQNPGAACYSAGTLHSPATGGTYTLSVDETKNHFFGDQDIYITDGSKGEWAHCYSPNNASPNVLTLLSPLQNDWGIGASVYGATYDLPLAAPLTKDHGAFPPLSVLSIQSNAWLPSVTLLPNYLFSLGTENPVEGGPSRVERVQVSAWQAASTTTLSAAAAKGATTVQLPVSPAVGTCLLLNPDNGSGSTYGNGQDVCTVNSVTGTGPYVVTLATPLLFAHAASAPVQAGPFTLTLTAPLVNGHAALSGSIRGTLCAVKSDAGSKGNLVTIGAVNETAVSVIDDAGATTVLSAVPDHLSTFPSPLATTSGLSLAGKIKFSGFPSYLQPPQGLDGASALVNLTGTDAAGVAVIGGAGSQGPWYSAIDTNTYRELFHFNNRYGSLVFDPSSVPGTTVNAPNSQLFGQVHLGVQWGGASASTRNFGGSAQGTLLSGGFSTLGQNAFTGNLWDFQHESVSVNRADYLGNITTAGNVAAGAGKALQIGNNSIAFAAAAPTTGTWVAGDVVYNTSPASGQSNGWHCTAGGTPGTWASMGNAP